MRLIAAVTRTLAAPATPPALDGLTERERAVLAQIARGRSDAEIGADAAAEVAAVLAKLGARDRIQAVLLAHEARVVG